MFLRLIHFFNKIFNKQNRYNYSTLAEENTVKPIQISAKNFNATILESGLAKKGEISLIGDFSEVLGFSKNTFFVLDVTGKLLIIKSKFEILDIDINMSPEICQLFNPETIDELIVTQNFMLREQDIFKTIFKNVNHLEIETIQDSFEFFNKKRIFGVKWIPNSEAHYSCSQLTFLDKTKWNQVANLALKDENQLVSGEICVLEQNNSCLLVEIVSLNKENITLINRQLAIDYLKNKTDFEITQCFLTIPRKSAIFYKI